MPAAKPPLAQSNGQPKGLNRHNPNFHTSVPNCPSTRRTPALYAHEYIEKPGVARGNLAASTSRPHGDTGHMRKYRVYVCSLLKFFYTSRIDKEQTPLQQHVLFWDRDGDGMIYPWDTYNGFRDLGFNIIFSLVAVLVVNLNFAYPTRLGHSFIPDPWFRVYVSSIHKAKVRPQSVMIQDSWFGFGLVDANNKL